MPDRPLLAPTPYHREIRDYLRSHERELWNWFANAQAKERYADQLRLGLLKSTYRLAPGDHPELYAQLETAKTRLGVDVPVTLYQAQTSDAAANAALCHLPGEAHIVLSGPLLSLLGPVETTAVFGHELAHRLLWTADDGDFLIAQRILQASANDGRARPAHAETARRYRLHSEIFADRGALQATGDLHPTVAALVKVVTGLSATRGESYLAQAAEIFSHGAVHTAAVTHPDMFMRAHALALWAQGSEEVDTLAQNMIAGELTPDHLDLLDQHRVSALTRRLLAQLLRPAWFRRDPVMAQARLYFSDFAPAEAEDPTLREELVGVGALLPNYFAYVILDFVGVDPDLDQMPLAAALQWSEDLGMGNSFEKLLSRELGLKAKDVAKVKPKIAELLAAGNSVHG